MTAQPPPSPARPAPRTMRLIGLIGGMSWESSAHYYQLLNELVRDRFGGLHSARCVLYSVEFAEIEALQRSGAWEEAGEILAAAGSAIEAAGAELILVCANTMHKVAGAIEQATSVPLLHLGDVAAAAVRGAGLRRVGLLGTAYTMEQAFYRDRLAAHGLEVSVPGAEDRREVHRIIFEELCLGIIAPASRRVLLDIVARLAETGAEGVVLACTELELILGADDAEVPLFPTTRLHAEAALEVALGGPLPPAPPGPPRPARPAPPAQPAFPISSAGSAPA